MQTFCILQYLLSWKWETFEFWSFWDQLISFSWSWSIFVALSFIQLTVTHGSCREIQVNIFALETNKKTNKEKNKTKDKKN